MAVTHLAERLKPVTPQLELLHDMCFHFMKNRQFDIFDLLNTNEQNMIADGDPITEIGVSYFSFQKNETPPNHYELLKKSVSGKDGDLARHGNRKTYLYFRRDNTQNPITAITLISPDHGEEPPLGFEMINRTPGSRDANLTVRQRSSLFLCVHRGDGPPFTELGVVHIKKEKVPLGWHHIQRTPNGRTPDLDNGATVLAYKRDYRAVIRRFKRYGNTGYFGDALLSRCFACLVGGIYSFDRQTFLYALEAFTSLDTIKKFPAGILADFVSLVRDALTAYISFFNREVYVKVLKWLGHVYQTRAKLLDTRAFMSMLHLCMFLRHEDSREQIGKFILKNVIRQSRTNRKHRLRIEQKHTEDENEMKYNTNTPEIQMCHSIINDLVTHVSITKDTQSQVTRYLNVKVVDSDFHEWISVWLNSLFLFHFDRFMAAAMILLAKVSAQSLPTKLTAKSEVIKRRIHALKLLAYFLEDNSSRSFFKHNASALVLLRRVVFTSFIHSAITSVPAVFKTMFRLHEILWVQYRQYLKFEIGVLLDIGMVGLLQSQFCTPPQKVDLLEGLMQMFRNKAALINIFYNYDNDYSNWPVCQRLINVVAKLTEGEYHTSNHYKAPEHRVVQGALRLLSRFMELMAKYLHAPHLNKGGNLEDQEDFDKLGTGFHFDYQLPEDKPGGSIFSGSDAQHPTISQDALITLATLHPKIKTDDTMSVSSYGSDNNTSQAASGTAPLLKSFNIDDDDASALMVIDSNAEQLVLDASGNNGSVNSLNKPPASNDSSINTHNNGSSPMVDVDIEQDIEIKTDDIIEPTINLHGKNRVHVWEEHKSDLSGKGLINPDPRSRSGTWAIRYDQHQEEHKIVQQALKKARQESVKSGVKFLLSQGGAYATLKFIAQFLYSNETLDKEEVGEFISALESSAFSEKSHRDLTLIYVGLLNFTGQAFDTAFRHFLTDCGFRLPKEAQKIDRLMDAFAHAFTRDNPQVFSSQDDALVLSYGVLMLNTELHNKKAIAASRSRNGPMSKEGFQNLFKNSESMFDPQLLSDLYDSVKENAIEMKQFHAYHNEDVQVVQKQFRNECSRLVQKALAKLRECSFRKHSWQKAKQKEIVSALYEVTWHPFLAAITTVLRQTKDPQTQSISLDAIKYSCAAAILLELVEPQLHAFTCELAKFVFIEQNKHLLSNARHLATVRGEHLEQGWFKNIMFFATNSKSVACEVVSHICNDMQSRVIYDADQKILRDIEIELGSDRYLLHCDRRFIHAGPLTKQSTKGDLDLYRFYLFNDILLYVSGNPGNLSIHRVLHLSLCKILDLRDGFMRNVKNCFRLVSPQKPILLIATTAQEKREWFQLIQSAILEQEEQRARWINSQIANLQEFDDTARTSKFCGRQVPPKKHERARVQNGKMLLKSKLLDPDVRYEIAAFDRQPPCKLCQRPFKRFTRKSRCPWCLDIVCKECLRRKTELPTERNSMLVVNGNNNKSSSKKPKIMKVCDGCFGAISYYISEMNHTDAEFSATDTYMTSASVKSGRNSKGYHGSNQAFSKFSK